MTMYRKSKIFLSLFFSLALLWWGRPACAAHSGFQSFWLSRDDVQLFSHSLFWQDDGGFGKFEVGQLSWIGKKMGESAGQIDSLEKKFFDFYLRWQFFNGIWQLDVGKNPSTEKERSVSAQMWHDGLYGAALSFLSKYWHGTVRAFYGSYEWYDQDRSLVGSEYRKFLVTPFVQYNGFDDQESSLYRAIEVAANFTALFGYSHLALIFWEDAPGQDIARKRQLIPMVAFQSKFQSWEERTFWNLQALWQPQQPGQWQAMGQLSWQLLQISMYRSANAASDLLMANHAVAMRRAYRDLGSLYPAALTIQEGSPIGENFFMAEAHIYRWTKYFPAVIGLEERQWQPAGFFSQAATFRVTGTSSSWRFDARMRVEKYQMAATHALDSSLLTSLTGSRNSAQVRQGGFSLSWEHGRFWRIFFSVSMQNRSWVYEALARSELSHNAYAYSAQIQISVTGYGYLSGVSASGGALLRDHPGADLYGENQPWSSFWLSMQSQCPIWLEVRLGSGASYWQLRVLTYQKGQETDWNFSYSAHL